MGRRRAVPGLPGGDVAWLLQATNRLLGCRSVATLLDLAYDEIRTGLHYDRVGLVLVDYERRTLTEHIGTDEAGRKFYPVDRVWSLDRDAARITLLTDPRLQPDGPGFVYIGDAAHDVAAERRQYLDGQPRHTLRVALRTAQRVVGLISVDNLTSGRPIYPSDAPPLVAFANALAGAVENVMLLEERGRRIERLDASLQEQVQRLTVALQREQDGLAAAHAAQRRLAFLLQASAVLGASLDYTGTLANVARLAVPQLADCCMVDLVGPDNAFGQTAVAHRDAAMEERVRDLRQRYPPARKGGHALASVVHTGQSLRVEDVTDAWLRTYTRNAEHFALMKEMGLCSYLCVPLSVTGRVLGALTFLSTDGERRYGADDLALAEELGRHAALAIDNARLYGEAQQAVRVRDHFLMSASHDLRTPLTVISGTTALLHRRLERGEAPDLAWMHMRLTAVRDAASRMASTVEEITDAAQLQMGGTLALDVGPLDLGALVRAVAGYVAQAGRGGPAVPLVVDAPEGIAIEGDRARLERVVQNIVGNAVKYSPSGTPVEIEVRAAPDAATVTVRDRGVGIPVDELPRLFTPFFRASTSKGIAGTGIGLAGSKTIVEQHGGHIAIDSVVGAGTTVTIALPRTLPAKEVISG